MSCLARKLIRGEEGATMVEYGLMIALIAAALIGVVATLSGSLSTSLGTTSTAISSSS